MSFTFDKGQIVYGNNTVAVSLQWLQVQGVSNYTINIRRIATQGLLSMVISDTMAVIDSLRYNAVYEIELVSNNCAGLSSAAVINNLLFGNAFKLVMSFGPGQVCSFSCC